MALTWRKSIHSSGGSGSGNSGDCVEIAFGPAGPLLRDSKAGHHGAILAPGQPAFDALLATIRTGN